MASYLLLFNCVVLFILFGSVVCPNSNPNSASVKSTRASFPLAKLMTNTADWYDTLDDFMGGKVMLNVTLEITGSQYNKYEQGLVQSHGLEWQFYPSLDWSRKNTRGFAGVSPTYTFRIEEFCKDYNRDKMAVTFRAPDRNNSKRLSNFTFTFASENDARNFTGEALLDYH